MPLSTQHLLLKPSCNFDDLLCCRKQKSAPSSAGMSPFDLQLLFNRRTLSEAWNHLVKSQGLIDIKPSTSVSNKLTGEHIPSKYYYYE